MPFSYRSYLLVHSWKCMALPNSVETQKTWSAFGFVIGGSTDKRIAHDPRIALDRNDSNSSPSSLSSLRECLGAFSCHMRINTSVSIHVRWIQIIRSCYMILTSWHLDWIQRFRRSGRLYVSNGKVAVLYQRAAIVCMCLFGLISRCES